MNRLIRIGILWCLAISIGGAQEADTSKDESNQRNPDEPQAEGTAFANSKAVVATTMAAETELPANSPIRVTLRMRKDESYEKIEQLIEALKDAGVKQMSFSWEGVRPEGEEERNTLILHLPQGFTLGELQKIESAANTKAVQCGLRLFIVTQNLAQPAGEFFGPTDPQPPQPVEPKRITVFPTGDAQESEVAMKFIAYLEKEGFATGKVPELILTPDSPLRVDFIMRHDESHEKAKEFLTSLGDAGVERIFFETNEDVHGGDKKNFLSFHAIPGYSPVEVERIENAAVSAAKSCGLALRLGGTYVKSWKPNGESATVPSLRPVELKRIAVFADVDAEPSEMVTRFLTDLESNGIANVKAKASAPAFRYPIQLNFVPKEDEPLEKIKQFIVALRQSGVEQINCDLRGHRGGQNTVLFTVLPGYSHEEQQRIENAVRTAAANCGLSIGLAGTMVFPSDANAQKITQLRTDYEAANKQAHDLAESLRQTPDAAKKSELRTVVQRAFTLRQSLLRAELQEMQARLEKTQQSLDMRDRMADQIVDRRVEDLVNPELKWDSNRAPGQPLTQSVSPNGQPIELPEPVDRQVGLLAKLQGAWDVTTVFQKDEESEIVKTSLKALVDGNRISLSGIDGTNLATVEMQLGAAGPPQQVDLKPVLTKVELDDLQMNEVPNLSVTFPGIIEVTDDGIRLCLDNTQLNQRPIVFAAGPATGLWELRRGVAVPVAVIETELEGDWHRVGASVDQPGAETPHFNITIHGSTWTKFVEGKPEAVEFLYDTTKKTIEFKSTPPLVYTYEVHGDSLILHNETQTQAFNRGHRLPPDATELEGDWRQMSSATDKDGKPLTGGYASISFRKNQYTYGTERGQHRCRVDVISNKNEIRYFQEGEYNFFVQDYYLLEGDQLTIYDENRKTIYRRVKERRPKPTRQATDEQKSLRVTYDDLDLLKILNLEPVPANAVEHFPDWLQKLNGKTVCIRGFMYPAFESSGLKEFTLARDNGICTFVRDPKIYEVISVTLDEGVNTDYIASRPFDVEGMFHIEPKTDEGTLTHLYRISGARILPVAAEEMDPQSEDLSKTQSNGVNDHPMQITGSTNSVANALATPETAGPVTELEGDWHRVAYIDKWQTERRPINMTIRANQETATLWTGESFSRTIAIDQDAKTIEVGANELKGGLPNQVVSEGGTYLLSEDILTIHSETTIIDSVSGAVIQKGKHTNIWKRGHCKIDDYDARNRGSGMGICHVNGSDENTGLGKLIPGDKVDVHFSFALNDGMPVQRVLVENLEVDGSSEPKESGPGERQIRLLGTREQSLIIDDANMRGVTLIVSRKLDGKTQQCPGGINADGVKEMREVAPQKTLDVSKPTPFP